MSKTEHLGTNLEFLFKKVGVWFLVLGMFSYSLFEYEIFKFSVFLSF